MLWKQNNPQAVRGVIFTGLLTLLASCGNTSALESMLKPDPKLVSQMAIDSQANAQSTTKQSPAGSNSDSSVNGQPNSDSSTVVTENSDNPSSAFTDNPPQPQSQPQKTPVNSDLPPNFPPSFPLYPQAQLQETKVGQDRASGMLTWTSSNNSQAIADYYQAELTTRDWEILKPFTFNPQQKIARAIAIKDEQRVDLTLVPTNNSNGGEGTKLSVIYQPLDEEIAISGISQAIDDESVIDSESSLTPTPSASAGQKSQKATEQNNQPASSSSTSEAQVSEAQVTQPKELALKNLENTENLDTAPSTVDFTDLAEAPEQLSESLKTVATLGVLTPYTNDGNVELTKFAPNAIITRGEYARWLIAANNYYYRDDPGKKIYVSHQTNEPAFQDVKPDHPDFSAIQSLAEAGLIPSRLTQDSTKLLFRPDAPLTREDLITWKVPLDLRQGLPKASIEAIEESWGFQDAADIDSSAMRALYADFQNGDQANVRRIFGFTTLFQPKKPVTRAEAAASLWYFGFQGDGITAQDLLETETELESNS